MFINSVRPEKIFAKHDYAWMWSGIYLFSNVTDARPLPSRSHEKKVAVAVHLGDWACTRLHKLYKRLCKASNLAS